MKFGVLGSGSWGTALAKLLTANHHHISWWNRNEAAIEHIRQHHNNPQYLSQVQFDTNYLALTNDAASLIQNSEVILITVPSAYIAEVLAGLHKEVFAGKKILSAIKGMLPEKKLLLNDFLRDEFDFPLQDYFAVLGPCHAEEVAQEKLSYLTFSGIDEVMAASIAENFQRPYINTIINRDIYGVQYAAVLKNIYAVAAGMAHGLDYGDNFLSVLIANSGDEMAAFLRKAGIVNAEVGNLDHHHHVTANNYAASVYLGDLLVTCYSLHSRNRAFGSMVGRGYAIKSAQMEMNMVAEGYFASRSMYMINRAVQSEMPIAGAVYEILWNNKPVRQAFKEIEGILI